MAKVGCAGILVADTFCGPMPRLPRQGELLPVSDMPSRAGGCAANVALDLIKQHVAAEVFGCLGRDAAAEVLLGSFREAGVICDRLAYSDTLPTSRTVILLVEGEDRRYVHTFGANAAFTAGQIPRERLSDLNVLYVGGLFAMPGLDPQELASVLAYCREKGIKTVLDVVVPPSRAAAQEQLRVLLPHVDCFLPNDDESEIITGCVDPAGQIEVFQQFGAHLVVITRGAGGAVAARGNQRWAVPAFQVSAVDPSGSGDAFTAGIITGLVHGWDEPRMLRYAAALGASATRKVGTTDGVFTASEAAAFIDSNPPVLQMKV